MPTLYPALARHFTPSLQPALSACRPGGDCPHSADQGQRQLHHPTWSQRGRAKAGTPASGSDPVPPTSEVIIQESLNAHCVAVGSVGQDEGVLSRGSCTGGFQLLLLRARVRSLGWSHIPSSTAGPAPYGPKAQSTSPTAQRYWRPGTSPCTPGNKDPGAESMMIKKKKKNNSDNNNNNYLTLRIYSAPDTVINV